MNDITFTVVGNVVNDVELRFTRSGTPVASFRVAATARRFDKSSERWVDGDTAYFTVSCWRDMARNVVESLRKGMPVIVSGRLRSREVEHPCKDHTHMRRYFDLEASAVGPDLTRGVASFMRVKRTSVIESEERALADAIEQAELRADEAVDLETGEIVSAGASPAA